MTLQRPARALTRVGASLVRVLDLQSGPRAFGPVAAKSFRFGAVLQGIVLASAALFSLGAALLATDVDAAAVCAAPGRDTIPTSGIINSYWGGASATNGGTNATITLGNQRTGTSNTPYGVSAIPSTGISAGDLLVVMQTQGPNAGAYEYVTAVSPAGPSTSGSITVRGAGSNGALVNSYTQSYSAGSTFQVIRVPQTLTASLGNYTAAAWDVDASGYGTGGVFALDVAQQATLNGTVNVVGQGFRGGAGINLKGNSGSVNSSTTAYPAGSTTGASKGEGTLGTPGYVFDGYAATIKQYGSSGLTNAAYPVIADINGNNAAAPTGSNDNGNYSGNSFGFGAIGNAGGGGNDANPNGGNNQYNSGGAGGGNAGRGGQGGWTWLGNAAYCSNVGYTPSQCPFVTNEGITDGGGRGGLAVGGLSAGKVVLGGGGGAASENNNPDASTVTTYPPIDIAVDPTTLSGGSTTVNNGADGPITASGGRGGGIVLIRAGTFNAGAGQILADGVRAYNQFGNTASEAAGGGGGGGAIVVLAQAASGTLQASAVGGRGGDPDYYAHGPGGGGGGGYVLTNFSVTGSVDKGGSGYVPAVGTYPANFPFPNHYGTDAVDGIAGYISSAGGTTPGTLSGAACSPDVAATVTLPSSGAIGATINGSFNYLDNGPSDATGVGYAATLTAGLGTVTFGSITLNGVAVAGASASYNNSTGAITFTGLPGTLPNTQSLVVPISFTMPANGTSVTGTDVVSEAATDPVPSNNSGSATVAGTPQDDDAVTITGLPSSAAPSAAIFGVLDFVNNGPSVSNSTSYTAKLPVGAAVSSIKYNGSTLAGASATVGSDGTVTFTGLPATLNPSDTVTVAFNATMPADGSSAAATATIASGTTDSNTSNNTASAIVTGQGSADLATTITGVPTSAQAAGTAFTGSVNFQNNGPSTAVTPVYTVQVPPGSSISASQVLYNGAPINGLTVTIDQYGNVTFGGTGLPTSLANGDKITIAFNATMPADGSNANVVSSISSSTSDPNTGNNNATATVTGIREADLQSTVTGFATFAQTAGTTETGMITFANNGPSSATGVTYTSTLSGTPTSVTLGTPMLNGVAITGATATYNSGTGAITYSGLPTNLNSGDKITVSVSFPMPGNPVTVSSNISSNTTDPVPSNNAGSQTVNGGNDLAVTLTNWPTAAQTAGTAETSTFTFSIVSGSAAAPANYTPVLTLTPGLTGVTITGTTGTATYNATSGAVTFAGLPTLSIGGTTNDVFTVKYNMPTTNVVAQASISENPNIDTYSANNSATATVPGSAAMTDVATTITGLGGVAAAGSTVSSGVINFTNAATNISTGDSFAAKLPVGATVTSITLNGAAIAGASATVGSDGTVTFTGMPTTIATSAVVAVAFSFPMPADGSAATAKATVTSTNDSNAANNTATAMETGDAPTDLQTKVTQPASGAPNATLNGTLDFLNNGPANAVNPTYQMTLEVAGGTPTITSVMLNGSLLSVTTSIAANGVVTFTGMPASLSPGDDLKVAYTYKTPASGTVSTTGQITYPGTDTVPGNNSATGSTTVTANAPTVMVTKTVDHTTHNAGDSVNWTLTVTNTGTSATSGVITLNDTLPSGITNIVITPSSGTTCSPANPTAGTTLTCSVPAGLAAGGGVATVGIAATLPTAGTYDNSVTPSGNAADNPTCAANACSTVTVVGSATMQVFKTSVDGTGTFAYALTNMSATTDSISTTSQNTSTPGVINVVTSLSTPVTINENSSPAGYSLTSASCVDSNSASTGNTGSFGTLSGTTLTIPVANIKQNSTLQCTFVNTAAESISIAKTGPTAMTVGTAYNYTLTLTNTSATATVTTASVSDQLPANFTFNSGSGNGWTCSAVGQLVSCSFAGTISAKAKSVITISATPNAVATGVINYATVDPTGGTAPAAPSGCSASTTCALSPAANVTASGLSITKSAPAPGLMPNANSVYTLTVTNNGTAAATAATLKDQLPTQLVFVSATGTGWTCANASGLITCTYAGSIAAAGTSTIAVTVKPASQAVVGTSVTNYASIDPTGGTNPPTPGSSCTPTSACASQTSTVGGPNIMVTKSVDQASHAVGDTITWTIKAANTGGAASAAAVTLTDTLPSGISNIVATPSSGTTCTPASPVAGGTLTCTVPAGLAATTGVATVTITATATATGTITNTVSPSGSDNPTCASGACSATTMVVGQSLTLQKALSGPRAANSDQFTVQISSGSSVVASATTTGSGNTVANGSTGATAVTAGTAYTLGEIAAGTTTLANYSAALACSNANTASTTTLPTTVGGSVTPAAGDRITCTITNSAAPIVTLTKALGTPRVHTSDQFTVQIANGATVVATATTTGTGSSLAANSTGATTLAGGTSYTLNEVASGGTQLAQYTSALACSNSTTGSATVLPTTVPGTLTPAAGDNISCTLTNTAKPPVVTYLATLTGNRAANTDQFTLAIANGATTLDSVTTTGSGNTLANNTTGAQTLVSGTSYTLTEAAAGTTNLAQYTSTLSCSNTDASSSTTLPTTLPATLVPAVGDNITCTVAIVPKAPTVTLTKALGSNRIATNDQFTLQINAGATNVASTTTTGTGNTLANQTVGPTALVSGTSYTLTEVASGGANLAQYTQALACSNAYTASTTTLPTTVPGNVTPQDGDAISCTLTNTGIVADVQTSVSYSTTPVNAGSTASANIVFTNAGPSTAAGVTYGTTLTTGLTNVTFPTLPTGVTAAYNATSGGVTFTGLPSTLTSGQSENITISYTQPGAATSSVTTTIATTTHDSNTANNTATATVTGTMEADVTTTAAYTSGTVAGGASATLNLAFLNNGPSSAAGVSYTTTLTAGLTNVAFPTLPTGVTAAYNATSGAVTFTGLPTTLTSAQTENIQITYTQPAAGTSTVNTAIATSTAETNTTNNSATATTAGTPEADVTTTAAYTSGAVAGGATATLNLSFSNNGPGSAAGVTYTTTLTTGLTNVAFPSLPTGVTAAYNATSGVVTFTGLPTTLTSGQSENIQATYTQPASGTSTVHTTIATTTAESNTTNDAATATTTGTGEADVTTTAAYTSGTVAGGATATLNLSFLNNGPGSAAGVTYTTTLTTGLTNVAFPTLPTGVTAAYNATSGAVTFTGLPTTLTSGQNENIQVTYTQPASGTSTVNSAIATTTTETNTANNTATATTAGAAEADVTTTAAYTSGTVAGGATATLNLSFSNNGPGSAAGVTYTTTLTAGLTNVAFPTLPTGVTAAYNATSGAVTFTGLPATLTSGQTENIQVTYTQPASGTSTVNSAIATTTAETNSANNTATATTAGAGEADVTTTAAYTSGTVAGGATATLNLSFSNNGPGSAAGVTYTTTLTTGLTNVAFPTLPTGVTAAYNATSGAVTFTGLPTTLTSGQSENIQVTYTQPVNGTSTVNSAIATSTAESNTANNTATATTTGTGEADVTTTAAYTSGTVAGGATATLNLSFLNNGPGSAAGVTYTTTLTTGLTNVAFPTLPTGVTAAYNATSGAVTFTGLPTTLTSGQTENIQVTYTQPASGTSTVNSAIATTTAETNSANNTATATTAGAGEADVTTTAAYTSGTVAGGATATLNLSFSNNGPGSAAGVTYTTTLTTGLTNVAFPTLPTGVTAAYNATSGAVTFTGLPTTLTSGQSENIQVTYTQPVNGTSTVNSAIATSTAESNTANNTATATTTGTGEADVTTTAAYTSGTVAGGATATLNLSFLNNGPGSAAGVTYTTTLTTGLTNVAFPSLPTGVTAAYNATSGAVTFTGLPTTLTSGQTENIQVTYTQPVAGTSTVNTAIATTTAETNSANNTATATTTGAAEADVTTTAAYTSGTVAGGATATLNLAFKNNGPGSAAGVTYATTLTTGLTNVAFPTLPTGVTAAYNATSGVVTFTGLPTTLTSGQSENIQVTYTQPASGTSTVNTAIATTTTETNTANDSATASTTGAGEADVTTTAAYTSGTVAGGATATLNVSFLNNGPASAAGVTYTTTLTTGLTNVAFPSLPTGVTAAYNATSGAVTFTGLPATLTAGQSEAIQITYTQPVAGTSTVNTSIATSTTETNSANNTATATTTGAAEADVATTASYTSSNVNAGSAATVNVVFTNNGPGSASGVTYTTTLTTGLANVTFPSLPTGVSAAYNATSGAVTFTGLPTTLTSGQTENIQIRYTQPTTGTSSISTVIGTTTAQTSTANDSATASSTGTADADVATTTTYTAGNGNAGTASTVALLFTNNGPASAAGVTYATTLTTGLANVTFPTLPTGVTAAYNATSGAVTFTGLPATLTSGQSESIAISYTQPASATSTINSSIATSTPESNTANNAATATLAGAMESDVTTTAAYTSGTVAGGATATLNLTFLNNGPSAAAGVTYTTTLTTGLTNVAFPSLPTGVTAAYNATSGAVTFTGLPTTLTAGQSEAIQITYTQPASGSSSVNTAISTTTAETNSANDTASATTSGAGEADVATTDTYTAANVNAGSTATVNVVYKNNGPVSAAGVTYTTTLTTGLANVTFPSLPTGVTAAYNATSGAVTFTGLPATLTSGQSENISISYTQPGSATSAITTAIATSTAETNTANNTATATVSGTMEADVTTTAAYTSGTVAGGATATLNLTFLNNGPSAAAGVTYTTTLTTGLTNVAFPSLPTGVTAAYNATSGAVTFTGLPTTLTAGQSEAIQITYTQPASGSSSVNTAISTTTAETNSANDTASATTSGAGEADVATTDTYTAANVNAGSTATVNVVYKNNGPVSAAGVTYTTTLTTGLANVTFPSLPTGVTAAYNATSGAVTFTGLPATLTSGQSENISISYTQPGSATSAITTAIATSTAETNTANNTATATVSGAAEADLATTTTFPAAANPGVTVSGTVVFNNNGPSPATAVAYTTTLSSGLTNVTFPSLPTGVTASYNPTTGVVSYTGLPTTLASGATETIGISYTQPASGASSTVQGGISASTADPVPGNNTANSAVTGNAQADLATALTVPATVNAGQPVNGTVGFSDNGPSSATAVSYGLTLPAGLTTVTFSNLPTGVTASYNPTSGAVTFTGLPTSLTNGQTIAPIGFSYAQPASGTSTVTSSITSATTDPTPGNNNASGNIGGVPEADTSALLTLPANVNAGSTVTGTLVFANAGPSTAAAVSYALTLSPGLANVTFPTLPTGVTASYNMATGAVTFTGLPTTLTSGQTLPNIGISYTQPASGTSSATATISSTTADPNTANNTSNATVGGNPEADTSTVLNFPANVTGLQPVSGTVTFANAGPSIANGVTYSLTLTAGLANVTFANLPTGVTASYNAGSGVVTFTGMPTVLGVNQSVGPITVNYTQPASGASSVTAAIASSTADPNSANNSATSNVVGTAVTADLAIQTNAPATVAPDGSLIYTLTITNNGPGAANNATFSDTLPAVLGVPTASCASASAGVTCGTTAVAGRTVSGSLTSLPPGGTAIVTITTTAPASGTFTDTATVAAPTGVTDPVPGNNTSSATTTVGAVPNNVDLSVTASGTTSVQPNGNVSYVVDVVNGGPSAANNAVFNYSTATPVTNVTWTCVAVGGGAVCPATSGTGNTINQTIATFPDGGHLEYTITGKAPAAPQQYVDTATITAPAGVTETNQANNTATTTTNVQAAAAPSADLATTINGPSTVQPGAPVVYTVVVTDNGPSPANGATLAVPVASQVSNVTTTCVASGGAVCPTVAAGNNISAVIATLPNGGQLTFTVTGTAPQSGTFDTSATVTTPTGTNDPVPSNNSAGPVVTTVPNLSADLSIQKNGPAQVLAGGIINYTIIVSNAGPNSGDGATVTDVLPAGLTNASVSCSAATGGAACGTAAITAGTLHAVAGALPAAGSITLSVSATAPASGMLSNSASVAPPAGVTDPNMANNSAGPVQTSIVASVANQADLSATISGPSIVAPNGTVTYVVTITNAGPAAGNNAPISDVLPSVLTNINAVCGNTTGGATCGAVAVNGKTVSSTIGALPVGASLTLTITATAPASGTFSNSASVGAAPGETDPNTANNVAGPVVTTIGVATGIANLGISKTGPDMAGAGSSFSYTLLVSNAGPAAANGAVISDAVPTGLTNIHATCSAPTNGALCGPVQVAGQNVTSAVQALPALGTVTITVTVTAPVPSGLQPMTVVNRATVTPPPGISDPDTSDNVSNAVETAIVSAGVSGTVWLDINHDKKLDAGDPLLPNWIVELFHNGVLVASTTTNAQGQYSFSGVPPGPGYSIDFRDPGSKAIYGTPTNGNEGVPNPDSNAVIGNGIIQSLTLKPGINIVQQSLPVDPSGVVYDATLRTPVGGATVTLVGPSGFNAATELVGGAANATQITESSGATAGAYQFLLISPGQPGGAPAGSYTIVVTPPAGYLPTPAKSGGVTLPGASFTVPGPVSASTAIQPQEGPPKVGDNGPGTIYYFNLVFNTGSGAVINNNVPLDRISGGALTVQKTGSTATADIGETVLYTVDVTSTAGLLPSVTLTDRLPRGFTLIPGSITINGQKAADPKSNSDGVLSFALGNLAASVTVEVKYRVRIGVGAQQGDGINRAQASDPLGATSNVATFKVDVNGGVFTTNACVVGKVFIDCNGNQIQDDNEIGIPGVRLYFSDGTFVVTDSEGKYSYCGLRPTTHTLKVDKTTMPPGSHLVESSNRNALDPNSLFIDLKAGELHQADFIEGSCSPQVMEETKARRGQGEVNAAQPNQKALAPALIFDSKPLNMSTPAGKPLAPGAAP